MALILTLSTLPDPTIVMPPAVKQEVARDLPTIHEFSGRTRQLYLEEIAHPLEYAVLAVLVYRALRPYSPLPSANLSLSNWIVGPGALVPQEHALAPKTRFPSLYPLSVILYPSTFALFDELHQMFIPGRAFQWIDLTLDLVGILVGLILVNLYHHSRSPFPN